MTIVLITLCAFVAIVLICIIIFRMREISVESKEINKRLKFWLSEKSSREQAHGIEIDESREESFAKRFLIPLGEQVGNWMSEKVPFSKQSTFRKLLIKAGFRSKRSLQMFYAIKIFLLGVFGVLGFFIAVNGLSKGVSYSFLLPLIGCYLGFVLPNFYLEKKAEKRKLSIDRVLPDALDLLVICTEAGMGIDQSLLRVAANLGQKGQELAEEIILTNREMNLGQERSICWTNMGTRTASEELKGLARVIVQSEKVGASIANVLRSQSDFLRLKRRQKAEQAAAKMTVTMMIPMALFIFPCVMAVTLGPPVVKIIQTFKTE